MKATKLILPAVALGAAVVFTTPQESHGFAILHSGLGVPNSNFRIFNDFQDSTANNNNTPHPNFPGYTGAVMAIWKGVIEWSSEPHGDGLGDPHQPQLGNGNSNFDPMFNGEANSTGVIGNNIHSPLNLSGGGTLAFMQGGPSGWWIRYYEDHTWSDGPNASLPFGQEDLQGVACHEHGHALGLDHTNTNGATMFPFASGIPDRSIATDDALGIQAIYGIKTSTGTKPKITGITNLGGAIEIFGQNFTLNNNSVYFTRATPGGSSSGESLIIVSGVSSTNGGTEILVNIPATAGPGDVIVKRNSATQASTSNAWPLDPAAVSPPTPVISNVSPGSVPALTATGGAAVTLTGTGFSSATDLVINSKVVGDPGDYSGSWTIVDDTEIEVVMPLGPDAGTVDIELTTAGGMAMSTIDITAPSSPALAIETAPNVSVSNGWAFALSSNNLDIHILYLAIAFGYSGDPAIFELDIGNNIPSNFLRVQNFFMGPKFWRQLNTGPLSPLDVPVGLPLWFQSVVAHPGSMLDYSELPWGHTNYIEVLTNP